MFNRLITRWLLSIARELLVEARELGNQDKTSEARVLVGIAAALNRADGRIE